MTKTPKKAEPRTFYIRTFGCQMNVHDSGRMAQLLCGQGLKPVADPKEADLLIVNSCSVRAKPEHKALSEAGRYQSIKRRRGARIILAGCVAQQEGRRLLEKAKYLDAVIGPGAVCRLPDIVGRMREQDEAVLDVEEPQPVFVPLGHTPASQVCSLVTIMKGCNNYCSYCIVPHVRGREASRPMEDILEEVACLAGRGCKEVTLLGQNVNSYSDPRSARFPDLLEALDRQAAVERIRFTTSHPKDVSPQLAQAMASFDRVAEHLHLALQSGSDRILEKMNRNYTRADFLGKARMFRDIVPRISLTTDLIVGFPSETEDDFQHTLEAVWEVAFDQAFSFKYSPRPGTAAAGFPDDVPPDVKARRLKTLQAELNRLEARSLASLVGSTQEVLVEGPSQRDEKASSGRTRCNRVVNFTTDAELSPGTLVPVQIKEVRGHTLWGSQAKVDPSRVRM